MQTESFLYFCGVISKNKIKLIRALETKKGRVKHGMFVAEGPKIVGDLLAAGFRLAELFDDEDDIKKVSFLQHPQGKVGVFRLPDYVETAHDERETAVDEKCMPMLGEHELALALDGVHKRTVCKQVLRRACQDKDRFIHQWRFVRILFQIRNNKTSILSEKE